LHLRKGGIAMDKKLLLVVISFMLLLSSFMAVSQSTAAQTKTSYRFVSGTVGGTWYAGMGAIAELLTKAIPGTTTQVEPGGSYSNIIALNMGEADFGFSSPGSCEEAWKAERYFKGKEPLKNFRAISSMIPFIFQTVALERAGIKTYIDLKGKRYIPALKGQTSYEMAVVVLSVYGLKMEQTKVKYLGMGAAIDAMKDLNADAYSTMTSFPQPMFLDLHRSNPIRMLGMSKDKLDEVLRLYPGFSAYTMKAGSQIFIKEDMLTTAQSTLLLVRKDIPEETVYTLTKALYKSRDFLKSVHESFDYLSVNNSIQDISLQSAPLHEGAARYYREVGLPIPQKIKP
jgi:uncharacterized protein